MVLLLPPAGRGEVERGDGVVLPPGLEMWHHWVGCIGLVSLVNLEWGRGRFGILERGVMSKAMKLEVIPPHTHNHLSSL